MTVQKLVVAALLTILILGGLFVIFPLRGTDEPGRPAPHALDQSN